MDAPASLSPNPAPSWSMRERAGGIVATGTVLALLYVGREVLVPITLAVILSLLVAPVVRALRRLGLGQTVSVLAAVLSVAAGFTAAATVIGMQVVKMTSSLPDYERTIRYKLQTLDEFTRERLSRLSGQVGRVLEPRPSLTAETAARDAAGSSPRLPATAPAAPQPAAPQPAATQPATPQPATPQPAAPQPAAPQPAAPIPVEIRNPPPDSLQLLQRVLGSIWAPLQTAGIVLVVLVFILLEREALRDRFIRIAGGTDIRATTLALNDAGDRLSRFFVSQFLVNLGVAVAIGLGLTVLGLPHALLWGALAGVLRFVPYVGIWIAALFSTLLGAAVEPGWFLASATLGLFLVIELLAGQLIEPQLYGHTTGLSPLSVVLAAIFWSWLWGPTGLIVSTPLTLCLVVAGRHIKALSLLDVLLGDAQALTMPQRFYQRALSGDSEEIIRGAREYLKRNSFAAYCDVVLMPALALARLDLDTGAITTAQLTRVRDVIISVIGSLGEQGRRQARRRKRGSVLDASNAGRALRLERERLTGPYQGPLSVPPGSVMLCIGLGSIADDLATELLVRILREQKFDARHVTIDELRDNPVPPEATPGAVSMVYLVSALPSAERARAEQLGEAVRQRFPAACLVTVFLPGMLLQPGPVIDSIRAADDAASSFGHAVQICLSMQQATIKPGAQGAARG